MLGVFVSAAVFVSGRESQCFAIGRQLGANWLTVPSNTLAARPLVVEGSE